MAYRWLILFALLATALWISRAAAHDWYDRECCSERDCRPVAGNVLSDGRYLFIVDGKEYVKTEQEIRPSMDEYFHACKPPHLADPICYYAPRAGS